MSKFLILVLLCMLLIGVNPVVGIVMCIGGLTLIGRSFSDKEEK